MTGVSGWAGMVQGSALGMLVPVLPIESVNVILSRVYECYGFRKCSSFIDDDVSHTCDHEYTCKLLIIRMSALKRLLQSIGVCFF